MVQGGLIRRLVPRFGEPRLIVAGIATLAVGLAALSGVSNGPALGGDAGRRGGPGALQPDRRGVALACHAPRRAGGDLRNALLGETLRV